MSDSLRLAGSGVSINLYPWLSGKAYGSEALAGILGFGLPNIENFWFDGAGSGSSWRGSRVGRRQISIPLKVYASNRLELSILLSELSVALDPFVENNTTEKGAARLYFGGPDNHEWFVDVVRVSGGDWSRKKDSDDRTYFKTTLNLEAGDPFWTRNTPERFEVKAGATEDTLLPKLARLRVGSTAITGVREVFNIGDTYAWPIFTIRGPFTGFTLVGAKGETVSWTGTAGPGSSAIVDMRNSTVETPGGSNLYGGLAPAPHFWSIEPGTSSVSVIMEGMGETSSLSSQWWPRRWAVV